MSKEVLHFVLVAGFNYSNPKSNPHEFDERALNRIGWYLDRHPSRRATLVFHYMSVGHGTVARSIPVDPQFTLAQFLRLDKRVDSKSQPGKQSFWEGIDRDSFAPVTDRNYDPPKDGHHPRYDPVGDPRGRSPMSILDVYGYVATLPERSVQELSIFSHSGVYGPILVNAFQDERGIFMPRASSYIDYSAVLMRDPYDPDSRRLKDFLVPAGFAFEAKGLQDPPPGLTYNPYAHQMTRVNYNQKVLIADVETWFKERYLDKPRGRSSGSAGGEVSEQTESRIALAWYVDRCRAGFREDAELWIWGCQGAEPYQRLVFDALECAEYLKYKQALDEAKVKSEKPSLPQMWKLRRAVYVDDGRRLHDPRDAVIPSYVTRTSELSLADLQRILRVNHRTTYGSIARHLLGVRSMQAFLGTTTDLQPRDAARFPLMSMPARFKRFLKFFKEVVQLDDWSDSKVANTFEHPSFPYAMFEPDR